MTFGEMVTEARISRGMSRVQAGRAAGCAPTSIARIECDDPNITYEIAEAVCKVFNISYPLDGFKHMKRKSTCKSKGQARFKSIPRVKRPDTMAADERAARELGISYGVYCAYRETGYLKTFIEDEEARRQAEAMKKVNIVESNVTGGYANKRNTRSLEARKL